MPIVLLSNHYITQHLRSLHLWCLETFSRATIFLSLYENVTPGTNCAFLIPAAKDLRAKSAVHFLPVKALIVHTVPAFCLVLTMLHYFPFTLVIFSGILSLLLDIPRGAKIIFTTQICKNIPFLCKTTFIFIFEPQFLR